MYKPIPEGFELLEGRSSTNAQEAIATALERGFESSSVRSVAEGYLIPVKTESTESEKTESEKTPAAAKKAAAKTKEGSSDAS